jgi:rhamnulokinase
MSWQEVDTITPAARSFTAFIDPDDKRFYNPENMEQAIVSYVSESGQPALSGRGEILRCVYESLALKYRNVNEQINAVTGTTTDVVHIVGGGSNNELLNQFTANSTGMPVMAGPKEATAVGNIMVQAIGAEIIPNLKKTMPYIKSAFPITKFEPQETAAWNQAYGRFVKLLK